jgi:hypothetical protein
MQLNQMLAQQAAAAIARAGTPANRAPQFGSSDRTSTTSYSVFQGGEGSR